MSGPATFANLTNRLLVDPVIRENYQFWFFGYPSGLAWTIPANRQRQALKELMQEYNPRGTSREMNNIVMVGIPWAASSPASITPPNPGR